MASALRRRRRLGVHRRLLGVQLDEAGAIREAPARERGEARGRPSGGRKSSQRREIKREPRAAREIEAGRLQSTRFGRETERADLWIGREEKRAAPGADRPPAPRPRRTSRSSPPPSRLGRTWAPSCAGRSRAAAPSRCSPRSVPRCGTGRPRSRSSAAPTSTTSSAPSTTSAPSSPTPTRSRAPSRRPTPRSCPRRPRCSPRSSPSSPRARSRGTSPPPSPPPAAATAAPLICGERRPPGFLCCSPGPRRPCWSTTPAVSYG